MSRFTMLLLDMALLGKAGSALLPTWTARDAGKLGLRSLAVAMGRMGLPDDDDESAQCLCSSYFSRSLVCYVSAIYAVKLLYYKRALLMTADPMVKRQSHPCFMAAVLVWLVAVFFACQYSVIHLTESECTGKGLGECCRDTLAPIIAWLALGSNALDFAVLVWFITRWGAFLSMFAEEAEANLMNQFLLLSLVMLRQVWNTLCHLTVVHVESSLRAANADSFRGTSAFMVDVCLMGTCIVLAFVDAQHTVNKSCQMHAHHALILRAKLMLKRVAAVGRRLSLAKKIVPINTYAEVIDEEA